MPTKKKRWWQGLADWAGLFVAVTAICWFVLWIASPDSTETTVISIAWRTLGYSIPISAGMWGVSRITRKGSSVPPEIANAIPYIKVKSDGTFAGTTTEDTRHGVPDSPIGQSQPQDAPVPPVSKKKRSGGEDG